MPSKLATLKSDTAAQSSRSISPTVEGSCCTHRHTNSVRNDRQDLERQSNEKSVVKGSLRDRIDQFEWSYFTITQSTGGIAIVLSRCPKQFYGLQTAGLTIFLLNVVLFFSFLCLMASRFILKPSRIKYSFTTAPECYFFGSFWLSCVSIIVCLNLFARPHTGPWMITLIHTLFWMYAALTFLSAVTQYFVLFHVGVFKHTDPSPTVFLTIFSFMLTGAVAANIAQDQPNDMRLPIIVAGISYQGCGLIMSLILIIPFFSHLLEGGLPVPDHMPALFTPISSPAFTIVALIGCAEAIPDGYAFFARYPNSPEILRVVSVWAGIFLWMFTFWLFALGFIATMWYFGREHFKMSWWSMIFPNIGFVLATIYIGRELDSEGIKWVATSMAIILFVVWLLLLFLTAKAVLKKEEEAVPADDHAE